jgi:hypothetical protein
LALALSEKQRAKRAIELA